MMGTGAYIFAPKYSEYGAAGTGVLGPGALIGYLILKLVREVIYRSKNGLWFKSESSNWIKDDDRKVRWQSVIPLVGNICLNIGYTVVMTIAWDFADKAKMNQGVVSSLLCFASVFNMTIFYCAFGEKISCWHLTGVILLFFGILIFAGGASHEEDDLPETSDTEGFSNLVYGIFAVGVGMGGPIIISLQAWLIRRFSKYYTGVDQAIDAAPGNNLVFCFFLISLADEMTRTIEFKDILIGAAAEGLMETSRVLLSYGIAVGLAGPAQALMSTHALWQVIWGAIFVDG